MTKKGGRLLKEEEFNIIKGLLNHGVSNKQAELATNRSRTTIRSIRLFDTFDEYVNWRVETWENSKKYKSLHPEKFPLSQGIDTFSTVENESESPKSEPWSDSETIVRLLNNINEGFNKQNEILSKLDERLSWVEDNMPVKNKLKLWGG